MAATTRGDILNAADDLFGQVGFNGASTREIAESCGVNKALIHYHFRTKDELFAAVLDRYYDGLDVALREALQGQGTMRDRLARTLDEYIDYLAENPGFSRIVQREAGGGKHLERIVARTLPIFQMGIAWLQQELPKSAAAELAAPQLIMSFYGMVVSTFTYAPVLEELLGTSPLSARSLKLRKRHLHRMLDLVMEAMKAEASVPGPRKRSRTQKGTKR
ncbi:MAG: TetR/AcrR family transcriptional regulator [Deltaproteobacteria bacterium]|nr:TetR/AcrR family transcriptional regulator [Deltaproteobacteria bacterium]